MVRNPCAPWFWAGLALAMFALRDHVNDLCPAEASLIRR